MLGKARKSRETPAELGRLQCFPVRGVVLEPGPGGARHRRRTMEVPTRSHFTLVDAVSRKLQLRHIAETNSRPVPPRTRAVRRGRRDGAPRPEGDKPHVGARPTRPDGAQAGQQFLTRIEELSY